MELFWGVVLVLCIVFGIYLLFGRTTAAERETKKRLQDSLADEFIYDPETGAKITLEQAESGIWLLPDENTKKKNEEELKKYYSEDELKINEVTEHLKNNNYTRNKFPKEDIHTLNETKILKRYDDWSYFESYSSIEKQIIAFFPNVELKKKTRVENHYSEFHLMFWVKINNYGGHYYFKEKSSTDKIFDIIRNDDDIKLNNYESYVIKTGHNIVSIIRLIEQFDKLKGLEIEINGENLFIKTLVTPNMIDFNRIEKIIPSKHL